MPKRPPKAWWDKTYARVSRQYPKYSAKRKRKITGGIWQNYSEATKRRIARGESSPKHNPGITEAVVGLGLLTYLGGMLYAAWKAVKAEKKKPEVKEPELWPFPPVTPEGVPVTKPPYEEWVEEVEPVYPPPEEVWYKEYYERQRVGLEEPERPRVRLEPEVPAEVEVVTEPEPRVTITPVTLEPIPFVEETTVKGVTYRVTDRCWATLAEALRHSRMGYTFAQNRAGRWCLAKRKP